VDYGTLLPGIGTVARLPAGLWAATKGLTSFLSKNIVDDIGRLSLNGAEKMAARQNAFAIIDSIGANGLKTVKAVAAAFPKSRVHDLVGNLKGWTSIDLVAGDPHAFGGARLLLKRVSDGWEFMIRNTH